VGEIRVHVSFFVRPHAAASTYQLNFHESVTDSVDADGAITRRLVSEWHTPLSIYTECKERYRGGL
jgi:hypothetical protein